MNKISDSKFNMWQAIIAFVHADGLKHPSEVAFIEEKLQVLNLTGEQKTLLREDLIRPKNVDDFYELITAPADRSQFVYFARLLLWCDGDFDAQEKAILDRFHKKTLDKVDFRKVMHSVDQIAADYEKNQSDDQPGFIKELLNKLF